MLVYNWLARKVMQRMFIYGVLVNSSIKMSIDVLSQTRKFYAQAKMLLRSFWYCGNEVKLRSLFK